MRWGWWCMASSAPPGASCSASVTLVETRGRCTPWPLRGLMVLAATTRSPGRSTDDDAWWSRRSRGRPARPRCRRRSGCRRRGSPGTTIRGTRCRSAVRLRRRTRRPWTRGLRSPFTTTRSGPQASISAMRSAQAHQGVPLGAEVFPDLGQVTEVALAHVEVRDGGHAGHQRRRAVGPGWEAEQLAPVHEQRQLGSGGRGHSRTAPGRRAAVGVDLHDGAAGAAAGTGPDRATPSTPGRRRPRRRTPRRAAARDAPGGRSREGGCRASARRAPAGPRSPADARGAGPGCAPPGARRAG